MSEWTKVDPVPCQHIADYYELKWTNHKCIAWQCLRRGYHQWAYGRIEHLNNLYEAKALWPN